MNSNNDNQLISKIKLESIESIQSLTTHGLPNLFRTKFISIKIYWFILTLTSTIISVYFIFKTMSEYYEYNVTTEVRLKDLDQTEFPTISLCNKNQFSTNHSVNFIQDRLKTVFNISINEILLFKNDYVTKQIRSSLNLWLTKMNASSYFANIKIEDRQKYTTLMSDSLVFCQFGQTNCNYNDFEWYFNSIYGNCYKFNSKGEKTINKMNNSLTIFANLNQPELLDIFDIEKGYLILIESKNTNHFGYSNTIFEIKSGIETFVSIKKSVFIKHPKPYSNCDFFENSIESLSLNQMKYYQLVLKLNYSYSQSICIEICRQILQNKASKNCLMRINSIRIPNINYCENNISNNSINFEEQNNNFEEECLNDMCPLECETTIYDKNIFTSKVSKSIEYYLDSLVLINNSNNNLFI